MSTISRITCPACGAECMEQEVACWQCGKPLHQPEDDGVPAADAAEATDAATPQPVAPAEPEKPRAAARDVGKRSPGLLAGMFKKAPAAAPPQGPQKPLIEFEPGASAEERAAATPTLAAEAPPEAVAEVAPPARRTRMTLTGEEVAVDEATPAVDPAGAVAATVGDTAIPEEKRETLIRLTFCKQCGHQNEEGVVECTKCGKQLEVVPISQVRDIEMPPRAWSFDVLGAVWIVLGIAAIYCGQFLVKADPNARHASWSDYLWTGVVACAPGVLIVLRHHFCKLLFWVMALGSLLVWLVIGFIWEFVGLRISDNGTIGIEWLAALSLLSIFSYIVVRQNDAFDFSF